MFSIGATDYVFAAMTTSTGARLFKIPAMNMAFLASADFGSGSAVASSPAGGGGMDVYVGISGTSGQGVYRVLASDLTVKTNLVPGQSVSGSPFISGTSKFSLPVPVMYVGTDDGKVYAANATNGNVIGSPASVASGQPLTSVFLYDSNLWTTGATDGHVYRVAVNSTDGSLSTVTDWYDVGAESGGKVPAGLSVDPNVGGENYLVWGTDNGRFYRVNTANANQKTIYQLDSGSAFTTAPAIDVTTGQVVAGNADGHVYIYPR